MVLKHGIEGRHRHCCGDSEWRVMSATAVARNKKNDMRQVFFKNDAKNEQPKINYYNYLFFIPHARTHQIKHAPGIQLKFHDIIDDSNKNSRYDTRSWTRLM